MTKPHPLWTEEQKRQIWANIGEKMKEEKRIVREYLQDPNPDKKRPEGIKFIVFPIV